MNILVTPCFQCTDSTGRQLRLSLPELLHALQSDAIQHFPRLRPHQAAVWHVFLVQVAVHALTAAGARRLPDAEAWRSALRLLTPEHPEDQPWQLVVADASQPAFLQPPQPQGLADYKRVVDTPDGLDMLLTSKNHDLKAERMALAEPEDWLYALLSLQTQEGFLGAGNYGVARMNGGFASRPVVRLAPTGLGFGGQVSRDVDVLLDATESLTRTAQGLGVGTAPVPHRLLWLLPWNGQHSLPLAELHPLAVEICRRVRLDVSPTGLRARVAGSKVARVDAKAALGLVADPWIPADVDGDAPKAMTINASGFGYARCTALLVRERYQLPLLALPSAQERRAQVPCTLHLAALARGQGKTEGFHTRSIALPAAAGVRLIFDDDAHEARQRLRTYTELAGHALGKALRPALIQLLQGNRDPDFKRPGNDAACAPWLRWADQRVDQDIFGAWSQSLEAGADDETAAQSWSQHLAGICQQAFQAATLAAPRKDQQRDLATARAGLLLGAALRKHLQLPPRPPVPEEHTDA